MSESLKLGHNLDFSSCDIMVGFHKSSHIYAAFPVICINPSSLASNTMNFLINSNLESYIITYNKLNVFF